MRPFISGVNETQFPDPVAMDMYATGMFPLPHLNEESNKMNEKIKLLALADDFRGAVKLQELRLWGIWGIVLIAMVQTLVVVQSKYELAHYKRTIF